MAAAESAAPVAAKPKIAGYPGKVVHAHDLGSSGNIGALEKQSRGFPCLIMWRLLRGTHGMSRLHNADLTDYIIPIMTTP